MYHSNVKYEVKIQVEILRTQLLRLLRRRKPTNSWRPKVEPDGISLSLTRISRIYAVGGWVFTSSGPNPSCQRKKPKAPIRSHRLFVTAVRGGVIPASILVGRAWIRSLAPLAEVIPTLVAI